MGQFIFYFREIHGSDGVLYIAGVTKTDSKARYLCRIRHKKSLTDLIKGEDDFVGTEAHAYVSSQQAKIQVLGKLLFINCLVLEELSGQDYARFLTLNCFFHLS